VRVLVVNNPRAGQSDAGLFEYVRALSRAGAEVVLRPLDAERSLARALRDAEEHDRVVVAGGDGTVASAADLLRNTGIPLLPYPAGTANLIAMNLGEPIDPKGLAEVTLAGRVKRVDLGEIVYEPPAKPPKNERRRVSRPRPKQRIGFTGIAGAGADAEIMEGAQKLKPVFGAGAYLFALLSNPQPKIAEITMELDGRRIETEGNAVLLVNFARIQFDLTLTHNSDATDGIFEVVVVKVNNVTELIPAVMAAMLDTIVSHPERSQAFDSYRAKRVHVSAEPALPLQTDGDVLEALTPFTAKVLPLAATFIVPKD
jgi:diacylglycerol kinase family enzyme